MTFRRSFNIDFFLHLKLIFKSENVFPDYQIDNVLDLDTILDTANLKGLIFDIDQTIIPFRQTEISKAISQSLIELSQRYTCCLLSNFAPLAKRIQRVKNIEEQLGIKAVFSDRKKPSPDAFKKALDFLKLQPQEVGMIGDRIFTDIIGANHIGMNTILVKPLNRKTDPVFLVTLPRLIELMYFKVLMSFRQ